VKKIPYCKELLARYPASGGYGLLESSPEVFSLLVSYIYIGCLPTPKIIQQDNEITRQHLLLVGLLVEAETLCWPELFNAAMGNYIRALKDTKKDIVPEHLRLLSTDSCK